jgi:S-adenosylmethionine/arginine decarboxylase-like enzyme
MMEKAMDYKVIPYGWELILDLHGCNQKKFTRTYIGNYFEELCHLIAMEKCDVHFWDDLGVPPHERQTSPHTKGTSAVCFILTSTIVVHTLDELRAVSCKEFDPEAATRFTEEWFQGRCEKPTFIERA